MSVRSRTRLSEQWLDKADKLIVPKIPMNRPTTALNWLAWLLIAFALVALAAGLWCGGMHYAHMKMKMSGLDDGRTSTTRDEKMGGMNMGSTRGTTGMSPTSGELTAAPSGLPGYTEVVIPAAVQRRIGVAFGEVEKAPLRMRVRTVGIVSVNETTVQHAYLKTEGWIEKLYVNFTGQKVEKGDPLLAIYSPDFLTAQGEYLIARQGAGRGPTPNPSSLIEAARHKMELLDIPAEAIDALEASGMPQKSVIMRSALSGTVLMKDAFVGQRVSPGSELFVVADLSTIWVQSKVYEYDLPHVALGQPVAITVPAMPGKEFRGKVDFVDPVLDRTTRTAQVRVELPNTEEVFKPGMFVHIAIQHDMGEGLLVPAAAVIRTGERDIAFRVTPEGHFVPVDVKLDATKFGDRFRVLAGLAAGEKVVTSANFLIDSESRLRWVGGGMEGMNMGGKPPENTKTVHAKRTDARSEQLEGMEQSRMEH